jgi:hydrogenase expression/formation protein HypC
MCIGIPMRVIVCSHLMAVCEGRGRTQTLNLALVGDQPPGTWVLAFLDSAREVLDDETAARINDALDALDAALNGATELPDHFADLAEREPALPPHLLGANA